RLASDGSRRVELVFRYAISSYEKGHYTIPAAELIVDGEKVRTEPQEIEILDDMALQRQEAQVGGRPVPYYAFFQTTKTTPFIGEKVPVELKVYFPYNQQVQDWGIPDFERDGVSVWRFKPLQSYSPGAAKLGGRDYSSVSYPSTLSANREGKVKIGPATLRLQTFQLTSGRPSDEPANLEIQPLELNVRPLPPGAPENFQNAIGSFKLDVSAGETEIHEGDPVSVTIVVRGTGNLDIIQAPKPLDGDGWKLYDAIPNQRGEERAEMSGVVSFTQLMRPLRTQSNIPAFTFVYFNPATEKYETLLSDAIPLRVLPSTNPPAGNLTAPKALPMPLEQMTDILEAIPNPKGLLGSSLHLPPGAWQIIPALIVAALLARMVLSQISSRVRKDPDAIARAKELREVERAPDERAAFYRAAGHFVERWLGDKKDPDVTALLTRRDEIAFRPESATMKIDRSERGQVLSTLKKLALPLIAASLLLTPGRVKADDAPATGPDTPQKAYQESRYPEAAKMWLESGPFDRLSSDTLFNIGNAAYRLGAPGEAALYYRRALARDGAHAEARQNLRFLERKFGSVTVQSADYQHFIAKLSLPAWRNMIWAGGWLIVIGLLVFAAGIRAPALRFAGVMALSFGPLVGALGGIGSHYYPDDARFAPLAEQMVVVSEQAVVRTDAARNSPQVITVPAGSLCRLVSRSGDWTYVEFASDAKSRGWVARTDVEPLIPTSPPEPPKVHPHTTLEGNNA
ncbi:MAG: hypothetical protein JWO82_4315, partial [Akkermansiaceae bacterium]|nr:hypothetical protein [Akkermansiaceae bacterium]